MQRQLPSCTHKLITIHELWDDSMKKLLPSIHKQNMNHDLVDSIKRQLPSTCTGT